MPVRIAPDDRRHACARLGLARRADVEAAAVDAGRPARRAQPQPDRLAGALCGRAVLVGGRARASISAPPSWGWLRAAFRSRARPSRRRSWARSTLPVLILGTERDRLVSAAAIREAAAPLPERRARDDARRRARNPARAPIAVRDRALARIDAFLDGHAAGERASTSRSSAPAWPGRASPPSWPARRRVLLLEAEDQPGYHSTGRSAAFWSETYGGPLIQPLTTASARRAAGDRGFLSPRGALHLADAAGEAALDALAAEFAGGAVPLRAAGPGRAGGAPSRSAAGLGPRPCRAELRRHRRRRAPRRLSARARARRELVADARLLGAERTGGRWQIETSAGAVRGGHPGQRRRRLGRRGGAAAGERPLGIQPYRRTIVQLAIDPPAPADLPLVDRRRRPLLFQARGGRAALAQPA